MKKAIAYIRISTKDQSNFSLTGQEQYVRDFAAKQGYQIIALFTDDGQSAKNFDRPDWKQLQKFCKENQQDVDALIVAKYDRFSRNLKDALNMIELLEQKYSIRILSAMEPILLDPNSPYFFQFRTQMLMGAQVEWLIIKDRTRSGINVATRAGRYINKAPYGYINKRDSQNKPIIVIDVAKAIIVRRMYQMHLELAPLKEIMLEAKRMGYKRRGHNAIKFTLTSPTYAGFVKVPAHNDHPAYLEKGIHEPIINEADWHRAQALFVGRPKKGGHTKMNEEVPLRAVLKCPHGNPLSAGKSRGKKKSYWYYRNNQCCSEHNLPAIRLHQQLDEIWQHLSLPEHYVLYLQEAIEKQLQEERKNSEVVLADKISELNGLRRRLDNVEEKFINDELDSESYKKWRQRYQQEISILQKDISEASQPVSRLISFYQQELPKLSNLGWHYDQADLHTKQAILRTVFNSQLYYFDGSYRTPYILPALALKAAPLKEKRLLIIEQPLEKTGKVDDCSPTRPPLEHLLPLLTLLSRTA